MSTIKRTVKTHRDASSMKEFISTEILTHMAIATLLPNHHWDGNTLHASGPLGKGTVIVRDFEVEVDIALSAMGAAAQSTIESRLLQALNE